MSWRFLLLVGAASCWSGLARSDALDQALARRCGSKGAEWAPLIREMAHRFLLRPAVLGDLVGSESTCRPGAINRRSGAVGLGQIIPGKSAAPRLTLTDLLDARVNLEATARHLARCLLLCKALAAAVAVYDGSERCRANDWSRRVLGLFPARLARS